MTCRGDSRFPQEREQPPPQVHVQLVVGLSSRRQEASAAAAPDVSVGGRGSGSEEYFSRPARVGREDLGQEQEIH
jgi:hypothetical protein